MTIKWLGTTAIALVIGSGAVIAQSQSELPQKREESPRAQAPSLPSKEADRPAAGEHQPADRLKNRAAQPEPKAGAKEPQRGEAPSSPERKQAQEPTPPRDTKQPLKQSQEKQGQERQGQVRQSQPKQIQEKQSQEMRRDEPPGRGERAPAGSAQRENQQSGRDAERPAEPKQQLGRDRQPRQDTQKQDNQARDAKQPADSKQQQGRRQREHNDQGRDRNDQVAQPSTIPPAQQGVRPGDTDQKQGQSSGQAPDQTARRGTTSSATINDQQRTQIVERLRRDRAASNQNINIQMNIGRRLPPRVRARPLPPDIVRIAPQYRGYQYTVVEDEVVIVHPRTHEVVDVIREPGSAVETTSHVRRERVVFTREQRETLKQAARRMTTAPVSGSPSASMPDSGCLALQPVPEELVRANPELSSYRYLAIGDQVVLVDPRERKIVEVID
jgi:hypothetical protein